MKGKPEQRKGALIFVVAGLLIAVGVAVWWFWIEQPRQETEKKAAQEENLQASYWSQLRLDQYVEQPFRLLFDAYDGDPTKPESLTFQVYTIDVRQSGQFVKIGQVITGTKFKVMKFEYKRNRPIGSFGDLSELTLKNTETGENVVLSLDRIADFPESYARFRYLWNNTELEVKKGAEFVLPPEATLRYRLIDITEGGALIITPAGRQVRVPRLNPK